MISTDFISILIPCRNEEEHIAACLDAVLAFDLPEGSWEVLVIDGMSSDSTRQIVERRMSGCSAIKLLDNPGMIAPTAMNIGIKAAKGGVIVRLDAHSEYPRGYIRACIALLEKTGAANAGGRFVTVPNGGGPWAVPVAEVTKHRFGVGTGAFRVGTKPGFVDTVPYGTFRREVFGKVGFYDERLTRNQDNEFNDRLRKAGYKIAFDPAIEIFYKNQATLKGLVGQGFYTGMWNIYTLKLFPYTFKWRRFIPVAFVLYLLSIPFACLAAPFFKFYIFPAAAYVFVNLAVSFTRPHGLAVKVRTAVTFLSYHLAYGTGTLSGAVNLVTGKWLNHLGKPLDYRYTAGDPGKPAVKMTEGSVSFVVIALNAGKHLPGLFADILNQTYDHGKIELIFVDGGSQDGTADLMRKFKTDHPEFRVSVLDNPRKILACGWNIALAQAQGSIVLRVDAHASIPKDFILRNAEAMEKGENIVGGQRMSVVPSDPLEAFFALAESSAFGAGLADFKNPGPPRYVDTLAHAAYRRRVFAQVGGYDERLVRTEDNEAHQRMKMAGFRFYFDPRIKSYHYPRPSFTRLLQQKANNGYGVGITMAVSPRCFGPRHFAPLIFILALGAGIGFGILGNWLPLIILTVFYGACGSLFAFKTVSAAPGAARPWRVFLPFMFLLIHIAYGFGTLIGLVNIPFFMIRYRGYELPRPVGQE
jgi:glycosyltransferase involved in cell wall biosynthesis